MNQEFMRRGRASDTDPSGEPSPRQGFLNARQSALVRLQRMAGNSAVVTLMTAPAATTAVPDAGTAVDADIEALDLSATAKKGAQELRKKHPSVVFTSGRRDKHDQAHAMASNIVSSNNRNWIAETYAAAKKLHNWVDANPDKKSTDELTTGLEETLDKMSDAELSGVSKHLSGEAFDVQPVTTDADKIKSDIRALSGVSKFLDSEGGLVRWHAQF